MKESSKGVVLPSENPKPGKFDVLEACEMLRACLCINRQAFSIVFMSSTITGEEIKTDAMKEFAQKFDSLTAVYSDIYRKLADVAQNMPDDGKEAK